RVYIGGRWGKKCARGIPLDKLFTSEDEVLSVIDKAILFYKENGITGERFNDTITRIGFEKVNAALIGE
ncbi:MAG: hypothetical protein IJN21_04185, partial [Clostridia bacterium]|nr:hypothetical protein [Clostridia bacterium]